MAAINFPSDPTPYPEESPWTDQNGKQWFWNATLTRWEAVSSGALPTGGTTGQVLAKASGADGDADWTTVSGTGDALQAFNLDQFADAVQTSGATLTISSATTLAGGSHSGANTGDQTTITGNAGSATVLQTARTINGVSFNGSANITVTAAGSTLSDTVPVGKGGTGLTAIGTALQVLRVNAGATALEYAAPAGGGDALVANTLDQFADVTQTPGTTLSIGQSTTLAGGTFAGASGKTLTVSNTITLTATDGSTLAIGTGGTLGTAAYTAATAYAPAAGSTSVVTLGTVTTGTWNGSVIAPAYLGTGTSITTKFLRGDGTWQAISGGGDALVANSLDQFADVSQTATKTLSITESTTLNGGTLTGTAGKTLSFANTLTLAGTDSSTLNIGSGGTLGTAAYVSTGTTSGTIPLFGTGGDLSVSTLTINNGSNTGTFSGSGLNGNRSYSLPNANGNFAFTSRTDGKALELLGIACSDETTVLTTGQKAALDMPFDFTITRVYGSLTAAPTVSACTVDIEDEGTSILNAVLSFGTTANNAETSTFAAAAASYAMSKGDLLSIDIDSVGSTNAGLKIFLEGFRT